MDHCFYMIREQYGSVVASYELRDALFNVELLTPSITCRIYGFN